MGSCKAQVEANVSNIGNIASQIRTFLRASWPSNLLNPARADRRRRVPVFAEIVVIVIIKVHGEDAFFGAVVVMCVVYILINIFLLVGRDLTTKQLYAIARPLVRANDELAQELVAQAVEVVAVERGVLALLQVGFCRSYQYAAMSRLKQ